MKIKMISIYVDDQARPCGFIPKYWVYEEDRFQPGPYRWLTVASPEEPDGTELQLALNNNPAAKTYQQAIFQQRPARGDVFHRRHQGRLRAHEVCAAPSSPCRQPT